MAEARIYEVATQPNRTASILSSWPIEGRAMLIEEPVKPTRKVPRAATAKTIRLFTRLFML